MYLLLRFYMSKLEQNNVAIHLVAEKNAIKPKTMLQQ